MNVFEIEDRANSFAQRMYEQGVYGCPCNPCQDMRRAWHEALVGVAHDYGDQGPTGMAMLAHERWMGWRTIKTRRV